MNSSAELKIENINLQNHVSVSATQQHIQCA